MTTPIAVRSASADAPATALYHGPRPAVDRPDLTPSATTSRWSRTLWFNLAILVLVIAAVIALGGHQGAFSTDEGTYQLQLRALHDGSWSLPSGTEALDPTGAHYPIAFSTPTPDGFVPLAKHPAWPELANAVATVTGVGLAYDLLGALAVLLAAAFAWALAGEHDRRWCRPAFWICGLSPMLVTAGHGWAHAPAAAAAGLATLGAVRLVRQGPRGAPVALLAVGSAAGMLLRTEGTLVALALGIAVVTVVGMTRHRWRVAAAVGAGQLLLVGAVTFLEARWIHAITGRGSSTFSARSGEAATTTFLGDRLSAAWRSGLDPGYSPYGRWYLLLLAGAALLAALLATGRRRAEQPWLVSATAVALLILLGIAAAPTSAVPGVVPAWPLAVVGLGAAGWSVLRRASVEVIWVSLYAAAILATQYPDGGADQWGGRFYAPFTVPVAVLAAAGIARLARVSRNRAAVTMVVAGLLVLPTLAGVIAVRGLRQSSERVFGEVAAATAGTDVTVTAHQHLPRMMWRYDLRWLVVEDHGPDMTGLLRSLARVPDVHRVSLVVRDRDRPLIGRALRGAPGWSEVRTESLETGLEVVILRR